MTQVLDLILGNLWRSAAIFLAACACVQTLRLDTAQAERQAAIAERDTAGALERSTAASWELSHLTLQGELRQCQAQWSDATVRATQAVAQAEQAKESARREHADWLTRWKARTGSCGAMLMEMERACPELSDY